MDPDAIIMWETKLDKSVKSWVSTNELYHRTSHDGGVLIALKSHYVTQEADLVNIDFKIVCAKLF